VRDILNVAGKSQGILEKNYINFVAVTYYLGYNTIEQNDKKIALFHRHNSWKITSRN